MSTRTKLILVLVLLALMFVVILLADVVFKRQRGDIELASLTDLADMALLKVSETFTDKLDLSGLRCGQQPVNQSFSLSSSLSECQITIPRKTDTDLRTATLYPSASNLDTYVFAVFDELDFPERKRDRATCIQRDDRLNPFRLEVVYEPAGGSESGWDCWLKQDRDDSVSIVALEKGGSLSLKCVGCSSGSQTVRLTMR